MLYKQRIVKHQLNISTTMFEYEIVDNKLIMFRSQLSFALCLNIYLGISLPRPISITNLIEENNWR